MPLIPVGSAMTKNITFNSGFITINGEYLVDVENVTVEASFTEKELRAINSIKMQAHKRATLKCGLKGKVKSINDEVYGKFFGTSTVDGSGMMWDVKDGQQDVISAIFTTYVDDDATKPVQFVFDDVIITTVPYSANTEDYGAVDFEMVAKDIHMFEQIS